MSIQKKWKALLLAARIEYHWWFILRYRRLGERWMARGEPLSSGRLLRLSRRIDHHGLKAKQYERFYETHYIHPAGTR